MTVAKPISVDIYCRRSRLFLGLTMKIKSVPALPLLAALNANAMLSHLVNHFVNRFVNRAQLNILPGTQPISPPSIRKYDRTNSSVSRALLFSAALLLSLFALSSSPVQASSESTEAAHQESLLTLSAEQRQLAGVEVAQLSATAFNLQAVATAQLVVDKDKTITIAPQLDMQVLKRHVVPGQQVQKGQPLLTIGGADIAAAQADYVNAATEWDRIKRMSKGTISASQRMQTEVNAELKRAILQSVMMSTK
jgi:multidrug efflux pump subunit AcrA (membrane-fusion protein)